MLQTVLQPIKNIAVAYVDDIEVHSKNWSQHISDIDAFLNVMRKAGLKLNLKKTTFAQSEVKMVEHYVSSGKHRPDPEKLNVIQNLTCPRTKTELRRALGMMGYYRVELCTSNQVTYQFNDQQQTNRNTLGQKTETSISLFERGYEHLTSVKGTHVWSLILIRIDYCN